MTTTTDTTNEWRVVRMRGGSGTLTSPWMTVAPGCPTVRHPTRDCACKVHRTADAARTYITEQANR